MLRCYIPRAGEVTPVELGEGAAAQARLDRLRATHGAANVLNEAGEPHPDITPPPVVKTVTVGTKKASKKKSASKRRR